MALAVYSSAIVLQHRKHPSHLENTIELGLYMLAQKLNPVCLTYRKHHLIDQHVTTLAHGSTYVSLDLEGTGHERLLAVKLAVGELSEGVYSSISFAC